MFDYFFGKNKVNEKQLETNKIKVLNKKDIIFDKNHIVTITGTGKFYSGTYKNTPASIKVRKLTLLILI
jgi:hypothetical protein